MTPEEFVLARLAEDEAVARKAITFAATGGDEWEYADCSGSMQIQTVRVDGTLGYEQHVAITRDYEGLSDSVDEDAGPHIALWDPHRVLIECEAKRELLKISAFYATDTGTEIERALAQPWVDHPDYAKVQW